MRRCRALLLLPLVVGAPGCSFSLGLRVASASGTPQFERERRRCVTGLRIASGDVRYAALPPDRGYFKRWLVWAIEPRRGRRGCLRFPVRYGRAPAGSVELQPAEPLVPGITYVATATGEFNIGGFVAFRIRDGAVEEVSGQ